MQDLLEYLTKALVDSPGAVSVESFEEDDGTLVLEVHVAPEVAGGGALEQGEYLAADLVGCEIEGVGQVRRVIAAPSCDLLEVGDEELLVPLVSDAVKRIDLEARSIEVDRHFLGLDEADRAFDPDDPGGGGRDDP